MPDLPPFLNRRLLFVSFCNSLTDQGRAVLAGVAPEHGRYTAEAIERRRYIAGLVRLARFEERG